MVISIFLKIKLFLKKGLTIKTNCDKINKSLRQKSIAKTWRGVRVVYGAGLENQ